MISAQMMYKRTCSNIIMNLKCTRNVEYINEIPKTSSKIIEKENKIGI